MGQYLTTAEVISLMLEECSKGSREAADECGINYSTFMRKVSQVDDATSINVEELIPYMKATESTKILDHLNERMGRMYVPFPKGIRKGTDPKQDVDKYTSKFLSLVSALKDWLADPTDEKRDNILEKMRVHQGDTENMRRRVRDHDLHQTEMDF